MKAPIRFIIPAVWLLCAVLVGTGTFETSRLSETILLVYLAIWSFADKLKDPLPIEAIDHAIGYIEYALEFDDTSKNTFGLETKTLPALKKAIKGKEL